MMGKLLLMLAVLALAYGWWRGQQRARSRQAPPARQAQRPPTATALQPPQAMLRCAHCGLHLPAPEATQAQGHSYCSPAHARLGPRG